MNMCNDCKDVFWGYAAYSNSTTNSVVINKLQSKIAKGILHPCCTNICCLLPFYWNSYLTDINSNNQIALRSYIQTVDEWFG